MAIHDSRGRPYPKLVLGETVSVAIETFRANKVRFLLTAVGMVIGTASLILVVTIGLTGKGVHPAANSVDRRQYDGGQLRRRLRLQQ